MMVDVMKTQCVTIRDVSDEESKNSIKTAAELIRAGKLVIFPTETVYGLGADATNPDAARAIYAAKGRPADNPLIIHIANPADAETYTYTSPMFYTLAEKFMPGPLTVILRARPCIPPEVRAGLPTVAVRCPSHPVAHALIAEAGVPIAAPSANLSGKPSPTCAAHVWDDMNGRVDMLIDGGASSVGLESTIVKIEDDGSLLLLRPGGITCEDLLSVTPHLKVADAVTAALKEGEIALSPGMKYRHYAPAAPVYLLDGNDKARLSYLSKQTGRIACLCYSDEMQEMASRLPGIVCYDFGARDDMAMQAHRLFYVLREADKAAYDAIYAPLPPKSGIGLALYNRMIRAAAYQIIPLV